MSGKTALHFASENGHTDVVELLAQPEHQALASKVKVREKYLLARLVKNLDSQLI